MGYSRIPVYDGSQDNIKGIIYIKDLLPFVSRGDDFDWRHLLRPAYFVPEDKMIDDLLEDFRRQKIHMAVVVDEFGGTSGIVTLEDVLEEIGKLSSFCKKPIFSREGANVELVRKGFVLESSDGEYGEEGYIWQELVDLPRYNGVYPILGSWVIGGEPCGLGIRENTSRITDNLSHFVPHIIA